MNYELNYKGKRQDYFTCVRNELLPFVPVNVKKVLDVGCGSGNFGQMLKLKYGCTVWGIEPNLDAALEAKNKLDLVINDVFVEDLDQLTNQRFDCIFFNDVLEHLDNPSQALSTAIKFLTTDGSIVASIPNIRYYPVIYDILVGKDFQYQEHGVLDKTHLKFFTKKSIIRLFNDANLEVIKISGINDGNNRRSYRLLNFMFFNSQSDMKYPQFALVAKMKNLI